MVISGTPLNYRGSSPSFETELESNQGKSIENGCSFSCTNQMKAAPTKIKPLLKARSQLSEGLPDFIVNKKYKM